MSAVEALFPNPQVCCILVSQPKSLKAHALWKDSAWVRLPVWGRLQGSLMKVRPRTSAVCVHLLRSQGCVCVCCILIRDGGWSNPMDPFSRGGSWDTPRLLKTAKRPPLLLLGWSAHQMRDWVEFRGILQAALVMLDGILCRCRDACASVMQGWCIYGGRESLETQDTQCGSVPECEAEICGLMLTCCVLFCFLSCWSTHTVSWWVEAANIWLLDLLC